MAIKKKFKTFAAGIAKVENGKRKTVHYLEDALQDLSQCCGIDCCEDVIRIKDKGTGNLVELSVVNGSLVVTPL